MKNDEDRVCKACSGEGRIEKRRCIACGVAKAQEHFTAKEWLESTKHLSGRQRGRCKDCMTRNKAWKVCSSCGEAKPESAYTSKKEYMKSDEDRACKACSGKRRGFWTCVKCKKAEPPDAFSKWLEKRKYKRNDGKAWCNTCKQKEDEEDRRLCEGSHSQVQKSRMP